MSEAASILNPTPGAPTPQADAIAAVISTRLPPCAEQWGEAMANSRGAYTRRIRGSNPRNILTNTDAAALCREALRNAYGEARFSAKEVAEDSGQSPRAAENWLAGENPMGLTAFLNVYHNNSAFKAWARKLILLEEETDPAFQATLAEFVRVVQASGQPGGGSRS